VIKEREKKIVFFFFFFLPFVYKKFGLVLYTLGLSLDIKLY